MGSFYPKQKMYELEIYRGVMNHDNEQWCKIWIGIELSLQNCHHNLTNLIQAFKYLKKLHFNRLLLTKVYDVSAKEVQKSYVWWHRRLMQNLKENWLVLSKMTRSGILELRNRVAKPSYANRRHTSNYQLENFDGNSSFELLIHLHKILN